MGPGSVWLAVLLLAACAALLCSLVRFRPLLVKLVAALFAVVLAMLSGVWAVNNYYGYYSSWTALADDLSGVTPPAYGSLRIDPRASGEQRSQTGRVVSFTFAGARSHITRAGLVYLPPQYYERAYAHVRFPVVELLHGSPGEPSDWVNVLHVDQIANRLITEHLMGPMVFVIPATQSNNHYVDCVNAPGEADETYLVDDVRRDAITKLRVSRQPAEWGVAGYSSGGYCAANMSLRHRASFGAAGIMDGYFRAADGPAGVALGDNPAVLAANSPLDEALRLRVGASPMPAMWMSAGTGDAADYNEAKAFIDALRGIIAVPFAVEPGAGHNFPAWSAALPSMLAWMWQQLAPPQLSVRFPIAGAPRHVYVPPEYRYGKLRSPEHPRSPSDRPSEHLSARSTPSPGSSSGRKSARIAPPPKSPKSASALSRSSRSATRSTAAPRAGL